MIDEKPIRKRFAAMAPHLDERGRRIFAAAEPKTAGYGGIAATVRATGIAPSTIGRALKELAEGAGPAPGHVRRPGAGRKRLVEQDKGLGAALLALIEPGERGDPESGLQWTCKSMA